MAQANGHPTTTLRAEWRASSFNWLNAAARDRITARLAGRSTDPHCRALRRGALERMRDCLAHARDRDVKARECGHRLPG